MSFLKKILAKYNRILLLVYGTLLLSAQSTGDREYRVKAAFIFNFTQFVEWPSHSFKTPDSPAIIGIIGKDPFGSYLHEAISGESMGSHPLLIRHFENVDEINDCHILFFNINDKTKLKEAIAKIKGKNILTISDANDFAKTGGMIHFYTKDDKINIRINLEAVKSENLVISSKLLKLADIVTTEKK